MLRANKKYACSQKTAISSCQLNLLRQLSWWVLVPASCLSWASCRNVSARGMQVKSSAKPISISDAVTKTVTSFIEMRCTPDSSKRSSLTYIWHSVETTHPRRSTCSIWSNNSQNEKAIPLNNYVSITCREGTASHNNSRNQWF